MRANRVSVIGAGFVGIAHAAFLTNAYAEVVLYDRDSSRIKSIRSGGFNALSDDPNLNELVKGAVKSGVLVPTDSIKELAGSSIIFLAVGLDFENPQNGKQNLEQISEALTEYLIEDVLVVVETTVPPGTVDSVVIPKLNAALDAPAVDVVYAYERVMPGPEYLSSLETLPKVYGANSPSAADKYRMHLGELSPDLEHQQLPNIVSAELAKILENTYRAVNIALVSEMVDMAELVGADLVSILEAIRARPTHSNIRFAGQAPGGYCLTKDPEFLFKVEGYSLESIELPIISAAISQNQSTNDKVAEYVMSHLNQSETCSFLGLSYRDGVGDLRHSSALWLAADLCERGYRLELVDPYVERESLEHKLSSRWRELEKIGASQAVLAVKHRQFNLSFLEQFALVLDINSNLSKNEKRILQERGVAVAQFGDYA